MKKKVVIVTGAAGALGQAAAKVAQKNGATVVGLDLLKTESLEFTDKYFSVNLLSREEIMSALAGIERIDCLLNIAGGFAMGEDAFDIDSLHWQKMCLTQTVHRRLLPTLIKTGLT